jgi:hypothetical protein
MIRSTHSQRAASLQINLWGPEARSKPEKSAETRVHKTWIVAIWLFVDLKSAAE